MIYDVKAPDTLLTGTSKLGYVLASVDALRAAFGRERGAGDNTRFEWLVRFEDGVVATLYDWGATDDRDRRTDVEFTWHVGGGDVRALRHVQDVLETMRAASDAQPLTTGLDHPDDEHNLMSPSDVIDHLARCHPETHDVELSVETAAALLTLWGTYHANWAPDVVVANAVHERAHGRETGL